MLLFNNNFNRTTGTKAWCPLEKEKSTSLDISTEKDNQDISSDPILDENTSNVDDKRRHSQSSPDADGSINKNKSQNKNKQV